MGKIFILFLYLFLCFSCKKKDEAVASNTQPTVSAINSQIIKSDEVKSISYLVQDTESNLDCSASVVVTSSNESVLPVTDIIKSGVAPNCQLIIAPSFNNAGFSNIALSVSDGTLSASSEFSAEILNILNIYLNPDNFNIAINGNKQLLATAQYSDFSQQQIQGSALAYWSSDFPSLASVDNVNNKGQVVGLSQGSAQINLNYKGLTATSIGTIFSVNGLTLSTGSVTGGIGSQASVSATVQTSLLSFDVTESALWSSSNTSVATVSSQGVIQFLTAGNAIITASYSNFTAQVNVEVASKTLLSLAITIDGGGSAVPVNGIKKFIATGTYSDSSTENLTQTVVWSSTHPAVASISNSIPNNGKLTALLSGETQITATLGSVTSQLLVSVNSVDLVSIAISPSNALLTSNSSSQLVATATYSDSSTADVTELVNWSSSNTNAATISNTNGLKGLVTTLSFTGFRSTTISAVLNSVTGTTVLGVNGATINSITVTPVVNLAVHQTFQLKAYGNLSDGGVIDLTQFAIWSSSSISNVSVSNSLGSKGVVTGIQIGASTIAASFNGITGSRIVNTAANSSVNEFGIGLTGVYYTWSGGAPPASPFLNGNKKGTRIDQKINFAWASGNAPMGVGDQFSVRWTGFYKAVETNNYFCSLSDDGIRMWINGVLVINNWSEHAPAWDCTANTNLVVGTKYSIVIEYYENGGGSEMHLTRSSVSAADARNTSTKIIPQVDLFPN